MPNAASTGLQWWFWALAAVHFAPLVEESSRYRASSRLCVEALSGWGIRCRGDKQSLVRLAEVLRIHDWREPDHIRPCCGAEKAKRNRPSFVFICSLPPVCEVTTCSTFTIYLSGASKGCLFYQKSANVLQANHSFGCCLSIFSSSGYHCPVPVCSHCVVHHIGTYLPRTELLELMFCGAFTHSISLKFWCIRWLDAAAVINKITPYDLLRNRMFSHRCARHGWCAYAKRLYWSGAMSPSPPISWPSTN